MYLPQCCYNVVGPVGVDVDLVVVVVDDGGVDDDCVGVGVGGSMVYILRHGGQ